MQEVLRPTDMAKRVDVLEDRTLLAADFGDAPVPYPVTLAEDGARHTDVGPRLGATRDGEADGVHSVAADADGADEDGITFGVIRPGQLDATVIVNVQNAPSSGAKLDGWIDFNGDGNWGGVDERVFTKQLVSEGDNVLKFDVPAWTPSYTIFARFRLSSSGVDGVTGLASDGEVEDLTVDVRPPVRSTLSFGSPVTLATQGLSVMGALDIDNDGDLDIYGLRNGNASFWLEQTGPEEFVTHTFTQRLVDAVDIDFDGDTDFLTLGDPATDITLLINQGDGTFVTETLGVELTDAVYTSYEAKGHERIADVDGDGDLDILNSGYQRHDRQAKHWRPSGLSAGANEQRLGAPHSQHHWRRAELQPAFCRY